ncbi:MAG: hypothetical protein MUF60_08675 [Vicinamibacterales bacterium]|jgi:nitrogen regulatory protein PII|nr:hypothetical protein [Vicinamibacterales bacterium]
MKPVKRLEIIVNALQVEAVAGLLERHGVTHHSVIRDVTGRGDRGRQTGDELTGAFSNAYVLTACAPEKVDALLEDLRGFLRRAGGVALVSDAMWVKH